jgi:two-component system response regulator FixJ
MPLQTEPVVHVIDDDEAARHSLKFLIECAGYRVADHNGALAFLAALPADGKLNPGCIVTDVRMPDMSGLELVDRLKQLGVAEPIIVITGHADVPMAIQAMKAGVVDFIEKPFADDAILAVIREALDQRSAEAEADEEHRAAAARLASLSQREREVLDRLVEGKANKVIAYDLGISVRTVEVYRANVMTKLQVKSLPQLVRLALGI